MANLQFPLKFPRASGSRPIAAGHWIIGLLVALCLILAANLFWALFGPVGSIGNWKAKQPLTLTVSTRTALFNSSDPFARSGAQAQGDVTVTSLSLTLFGTRMNEFSGSGSAILAGADGVQQSYAVGEEVMPGVVLSQVAFDHVVLTRNGVKESLFIDQSVPAANVSPQGVPPLGVIPEGVTMQPADVKLNATSLRDSVSVAPRNEGGKVTGLVITAKDDGAMLRNAGLSPGDIVVSINGQPVGSASDIAAQFRPGAKLTLEVERGSQKIPVGLNLE